MNRRAMGLLLVFVFVGMTACSSESRASTLRLGTTYTLDQSGALAFLDSLHPPVPVRVIIESSGQIIHSAAGGDLDVVITHAPSLEQRLLVAAGHVALRCPFVSSRFAIVGPPSDPAGVAGAPTAADAFHRIAVTRASFISRGDSSGTHIKELSLWQAGGIARPGKSDTWYIETGLDQAGTVRLADERGAYALADLPTFTRLTGLDLRVLFTADTALGNPYTLYVIHSASAQSAAEQFSTWALAEWRSRLLALRLPDGERAFAPLAGGCAAPAASAER